MTEKVRSFKHGQSTQGYYSGRRLRYTFLPATKAQPKEMLPIVDTPAIQYIVEEALPSGIEEILIITGRNKRAIEDHFDTSVELEQLLQQQGKKNSWPWFVPWRIFGFTLFVKKHRVDWVMPFFAPKLL